MKILALIVTILSLCSACTSFQEAETPSADAPPPSVPAKPADPEVSAPSVQTPETPVLPPPAALPAPVYASNDCGSSDSAFCCSLSFATHYVGGTRCVGLYGDMGDRQPAGSGLQWGRETPPIMSWKFGAALYGNTGDAYLTESFHPSNLTAGTFDISYRSDGDRKPAWCGGSHYPEQYWADYGAPANLAGMTPEARSWIHCNWFDAESGTTVDVADPACTIRVQVEVSGSSCSFVPAGNMSAYSSGH